MPIQFQCPHCRHAMQLPDTAAGKQGKCPKCSSAVTVPAVPAAAPASPHDEEFWSELGEQKEAVHDEHDAPQHGKKQSDAQILKRVLGKADAAKVVKRIGMPWERRSEGRVFDRFWDTAIGVMNNATDTFNEMKLTGGVGSPLKFMLIGVILGSLILAVYGTVGAAVLIIPTSGGDTSAADAGEDAEEVSTGIVVTPAMAISIVLAFLIVFFGFSIGGFIHVFLQAAGLQLALPMVGVKDSNFEKNFRVVAFTNGSIYLCNIVPGLGGAFMLFIWFLGMIKGLASVYEISDNTATMAVLILFVPLVLPIVAVVVFFALKALGYI